MTTTLSVSQARRRLRRLIVLVVQGHTFVLTKNGKEMCRLVSAEEKTRTH
ncbi:type II toxin-antitoxin system prevent-host-death family antitoxin [Pseudomonas sp. PMCC200344]|nr:type II toxin-antitoxin system prevent-host-death family antitoxin [Pseudomonas sp. PMCC200344]